MHFIKDLNKKFKQNIYIFQTSFTTEIWVLPYLPSIEAGALEDYVKSIYPTISILDRKLEPIVQTNASIQHVFIKYKPKNCYKTYSFDFI